MTETKKKSPKVTTPRGTFVWPKLASPDTKFDADGTYSVKLKLDGDAFAELSAVIQPIFDDVLAESENKFAELSVAARKKLKTVTVNDWYSPVYDDDENETGEYTVNFSAKAGGTRKDGTAWSRGPIPCFDGRGKPFKAVDKIWSGSEGKVSFTYNDYFIPGTATVGVKLQLQAVQVLELASGGSSESYGFGAEDDGFDGSDVTSDTVTDTDTDTDDSAGADF